MDRLIKTFSDSLVARALALGAIIAIALIVTIPFVAPAGSGLKFAYFVGYLTPAILLGAIVGWLTFNRTAWFVATAVGLVICISFYGRDVGFHGWDEPKSKVFFIERGTFRSWSGEAEPTTERVGWDEFSKHFKKKN